MAEGDPTFRDFAGALMGQDLSKAADVLQTLLGVEPETATAATQHFHERMTADQAFMMKAMTLRSTVQEGSREDLEAQLGELFALSGEQASKAADAVLTRFR